MKSYSKLQNYLSLLMFITINILFYFKYLSKISIACGAITSVLYILFIIFLFKYKPTFGRKLVNVGIITFIIATSSLLFFIPKEIFTADRWIIIDLFWDSVSNGLYPYAEKTSIGNYPGAMPFYFLLCYPFYCIREIGFITVISIALLAFHFKRKSVQSYSLFFIFSISSLCIYWEIFSRSTILINAVLFTLFLLYLERFCTFSTRQLIWSAVIGGLLFSIRNVFVLPLIVWGLYQLFQEKTSPKKIFLWGFVFLLSFAITFVPFIWLYPDEFWEVNPFSTQSSLVSFHFIVLFVLIAIAGSFFCRNYNDVRFFSVLLLFGIVTIHFIEAVCQYSFTQALFQSKADISYYIFCIPYLLQILADTDYKRLMNPQT